MTKSKEYLEGGVAARVGATYEQNPYIVGYTRLGAPRLGSEGEEWERGRAAHGRTASRSEIEEATRLTDLSQFRSRHRRLR